MYHERRPDEERPAVRWLPFQLNPDLPAEGIPRQEYLERKFGPGHSHSYARVAGVGREVGIDFAFDRITVQPNTLHAHRLMLYGARQGREDAVADQMRRDAKALQDAGADIVLLECIPAELGKQITAELHVPVIGIGAGPDTDGQILVLYDVLDITPGRKPRFVQNFMVGQQSPLAGIKAYVQAVKSRAYPAAEHCF